MNEKKGLATREEFNFFVKVAAGEIEGIPAYLKPIIKWFLPAILDGLDDKVGDKIPEPWQTYTENLVTMLYNAMQDNVIDETEQLQIIEYCSEVMNEKIDVPLLDEEDEAMAFMFILQGLASFIRKAMKKLKEKK